MNNVEHHAIKIEYDTWEPFKKLSDTDLDKMIHDLKEKRLLPHCGNVKLTIQ